MAKFTPAERAERRRRAWDLRVEGYTLTEISRELKVGLATVHNDLERMGTPARRESNRVLLEIELDRLDRMTRVAQARALDTDDFGNIYAMDRVLAMQNRRAAYLGLDAKDRGTDHNDVDAWLNEMIGDTPGADHVEVDHDLDSEVDDETA